ncbi:hypothetical protein NMG60_11003756 [Bertholletia excelsa]
MTGPSHPKASLSLHVFSMKSPSSSSSSSSSPSTLSSMKLKTLVQTLIFSHLCRFARTLSKAKSIFIQIFKDIQNSQFISKNKLFFGSFRLHYNWCSSSHVLPVPSPVLDGYVYYDATWNPVIGKESDDAAEPRGLSGYLQWLEEKAPEDSNPDHENEIDKLADLFIANCHEKFRLEKQESYRRFQEMLARSA